MSKKNSIKLRYVKGTCELETGIVKFIGSLSGVSNHQAWYYTIYAIKDRFPEIDYWIDPIMEECRGLTSSENKLRKEIQGKFSCVFQPFPNGIIKPKKKLSDFSKNKYLENRAFVDLGVDVQWGESLDDKYVNVIDNEIDDEIDGIPCGPTPYICTDGIRSSIVRNNLDMVKRYITNNIGKAPSLNILKSYTNEVKGYLNQEYSFKDSYMLRITDACEELINACKEAKKECGLNDVEIGICFIEIINECEEFLKRNN